MRGSSQGPQEVCRVQAAPKEVRNGRPGKKGCCAEDRGRACLGSYGRVQEQNTSGLEKQEKSKKHTLLIYNSLPSVFASNFKQP